MCWNCLVLFLLVIFIAISVAGVTDLDRDTDAKHGLDKGFEYNKPVQEYLTRYKALQTKSESPEPSGSPLISALLLPAAERNRNLLAKGGNAYHLRELLLSNQISSYAVQKVYIINTV